MNVPKFSNKYIFYTNCIHLRENAFPITRIQSILLQFSEILVPNSISKVNREEQTDIFTITFLFRAPSNIGKILLHKLCHTDCRFIKFPASQSKFSVFLILLDSCDIYQFYRLPLLVHRPGQCQCVATLAHKDGRKLMETFFF